MHVRPLPLALRTGSRNGTRANSTKTGAAASENNWGHFACFDRVDVCLGQTWIGEILQSDQSKES